jgi:hypothetical protein
VERSVGLLFIKLEPQDPQLYEEDDRVNTLAASALQDILVPLIEGITVSCKVLDEQTET